MIVTIVRDNTGQWHRFKITDSIDPPLARMYCSSVTRNDELMARYQYDSPMRAIESPIFTSADSYWCQNCKETIFIDNRLDVTIEKEETVNHPLHYGGEDNIYEAIKVIEAWGLGFSLGNCVKYISRAGRKDDYKTDLKKAAWYLQREIDRP